ncbi:MAG TPA: hypothetical protein VF918_23310 [Anaerolineales bacterium]
MIGRLAITTGISGLLALVLLILFFTIGGPFGTLNDICNGITGILSGVLAWSLSNKFQAGLKFFILSLIGALAVALGSVLVIFEITGWYLAGLYTSAGYALIGLWLLALNYSVRQINPWPHRLVNWGLISGSIMALGLLTISGIINGIDAWELGPWYVNYIGQLGSVGYLLLYPLWCILVGRSLLLTLKSK